MRERLKTAKRIVVKIGTSTLTYSNGQLNLHRIDHLVRVLSDIANQGREVIFVSSGATATGMGRLGLSERPKEMGKKQALAAIGQGVLMHIYEKFFSEYGKTTAQVLLTKEVAVRHHQYQNARNTLMAMGVIPIINENDAIAVDEFKIGDNDNLSAIVATIVDADLLIILSDIDGLYTDNPQKNPDAELIYEVSEITPDIEAIAGGAGSGLGTGGMSTKIEAGKVAVNAGVNMVISSGAQPDIMLDILEGKKAGTFFPARESHLRVRKSWLAFGKRIEGELIVDEGCVKAMNNDSSLLAIGITNLEGDFQAGATLRVLSPGLKEIARGITNYSSTDLRKILGHHTSEFPKLIEGKIHEEVIHRDNMVIML